MNRTTRLALIRFAALALLLQAPLAAVHAQYDPRPVVVNLLPEAVVDDTIVTLDQIAKLSGGSETLRKRLGNLDVTDFPYGASHRVVTSDQVRFRLLLADMEVSEFRLGGAKRTTIVEPDEAVSLRKLLAAAEQAVRHASPAIRPTQR